MTYRMSGFHGVAVSGKVIAFPDKSRSDIL